MSLLQIIEKNSPPEISAVDQATPAITAGGGGALPAVLPACPASNPSHKKFWVDALGAVHCWDCEPPAALSLIRSYYSLDPVTWDVTPPPPAIRAAALAEMAKTDPVGALAAQEALDPAWMTWLDEATGRRVLCHRGHERECREALRWRCGKEQQETQP